MEANDYSKNSLEFLFSETDKFAEELLNSIRRNINKSYVVVGVCSSTIIYAVKNYISNGFSLENTFLLVGPIIAIAFIYENLKPVKQSLRGINPETIKANDKSLDEKKLITSQIIKYKGSIKKNTEVIKTLTTRFKKSVTTLICSYLVYGLYSLFSYYVGLIP